MSNDLLDNLSEPKLPALPSEPPGEPTEPIERSDVFERGRSPDEVVQARETRLPADERQYEVGGVRYTAKELEQTGVLEDLAVTHSKYQQLQAQHQAQLAEAERRRAEVPAPQITNAMVARVYDQVAEVIT